MTFASLAKSTSHGQACSRDGETNSTYGWEEWQSHYKVVDIQKWETFFLPSLLIIYTQNVDDHSLTF